MDIREQLLAAAVEVVTEHGTRGATTRRIAEAAAVNEVTLFRHFGSKDALIREAMHWNAGRELIPALPDEPGDVAAELLAWAEAVYAHLSRFRGLIRTTFGECAANPEVAPLTRKVPQTVSRGLRRYLERARKQRLVSTGWDVHAASGMLMGTLFLDAIFRDVTPDTPPFPPAQAPRVYVDLFLRAIGHDAHSRGDASPSWLDTLTDTPSASSPRSRSSRGSRPARQPVRTSRRDR
jgi:AcrR family transcriptional regulator